jgi:glycerate 2-kinase
MSPRPKASRARGRSSTRSLRSGRRDLCLCLISGGGSALLPAPIAGITLEDKVQLTRELSACGATIEELNAVRREISLVKGGGLARACGAGRLFSLILSDVLGDPLDFIASGPTVLREATPERAIEVLTAFGLAEHPAGKRVIRVLQDASQPSPPATGCECRVTNLVIGNNATAVDAAGIEAERLGYNHVMISANKPEGTAEEVASTVLDGARLSFEDGRIDCFISGGEPIVQLAPEGKRGRGGRNQQLALAALELRDDWRGWALLSGGTDGEDGPTDAAGAIADEQIAQEARVRNLDPADYLRRNDAYNFFEPLGALLKTGQTNTNVCDLRVVLTAQQP